MTFFNRWSLTPRASTCLIVQTYITVYPKEKKRSKTCERFRLRFKLSNKAVQTYISIFFFDYGQARDLTSFFLLFVDLLFYYSLFTFSKLIVDVHLHHNTIKAHGLFQMSISLRLLLLHSTSYQKKTNQTKIKMKFMVNFQKNTKFLN